MTIALIAPKKKSPKVLNKPSSQQRSVPKVRSKFPKKK